MTKWGIIALFFLLMHPLTVQEKMLFGYSLSINTLTAPEWEALPGIGPKLAGCIVSNRNEQGPFPDLKALRRVPGLGEKTLRRVTPYIQGQKPQTSSF